MEGEGEITAHTIVVQRTARYYSLGPLHGFPREVWYACHGFGQLADRFLQSFVPLDDGARLLIAPEALNRFYLDPLPERRRQLSARVGATWMTREFRDAEIGDYVAYLEALATETRARLAGASPRTIVVGFSQGTATVCRWLAASQHRVDQLVLWGGQIPPELDVAAWADRLHGAAITLVVGDSDEYITAKVIEAEVERLSDAGVAFALHRFDGGHVVDADALRAVAASFIAH